jgi:WhiB family redox-sensing transcriptional regulator
MDPDAVNMLDEVTHRPAWHARAACAGKGPDLFFPERGDSSAPAKALCAACPVQRQCLDVALADASVRGIWGGVSERGRRVLRRGAA